MDIKISYEKLSVAAADALRIRPFNYNAVRALTLGSLVRFLTQNKQACKSSEGKRRLVEKCRDFIERVEAQEGLRQALVPVMTGVLPKCMVCARPYKGEYVLCPCGHTGCCDLCRTRMQSQPQMCGLYEPPLSSCPVCNTPSTFVKIKFV